MKLHNLPKLIHNRKKRVGRGIGTGKGKTAGRGTKGQKARGKIPQAAVGGGLILYKKLPLLRGYSRRGTKRLAKKKVIKLADLNKFKTNSIVDLQSLVEHGLISEKESNKSKIKIVAGGQVTIPLTIKIPLSKKAKEYIEKAGGKVV